MKWVGHVARTVEKGNVYSLLVVKSEGKRPLGSPRSRWIDNIKMDFQRWDWVVWTGLVWLRIGAGEELL
jgi:hypothetical protein